MSDPVYVGLMSGTSLDGISAAAVRFIERRPTLNVSGSTSDVKHETRNLKRETQFDYELLAFTVTEYKQDQRERLLASMQKGSAEEYCRLGFDLGGWLADAAVAVIAEAGVPLSEIRAIGTHGQTLWHVPLHSTWQIGESAVIAERLGIDVVSDFRVRDVAAGGQGAPLVPIADGLLFSADHWRALQNIGGIGNVTVVPPGGIELGERANSTLARSSKLEGVRAFDTGPGVGVIDAVVKMLRPEMRFDRDGLLARAGTPVEEVLDELLAHPYFAAEPPKSTGRELFTPEYVTQLVKKCRATRPKCSDEDVIATATALTARSIADAYRRFMPEPVTEMLASGGGSKNKFLLESLRDLVAPIAVRVFDEVFFDGEAKEAVAFALLAKLFVEGRAGNVPGATGAKGSRILGKLTPGRNP